MASARGADVTYAGWVFKEGSLVKSWKKRFLVAKRAEIAYYKNTEQENKAQLLGAMTVARVEKAADITNGLLLVSVEGRQLKVFTETQKECDKCFNAIARYASEQSSVGRDSMLTPRQVVGAGPDAVKHVGWLEKEGQYFKTWKKRYFVLEENMLSYSADIGSASISKARVIAARRDLTRPNTLVVMMEGGRELKIGGKTEEEIHDWHKALRRAIMKHGGHRSPAHGRSPGNPGMVQSPAPPPPPYSPAFQQQGHHARQAAPSPATATRGGGSVPPPPAYAAHPTGAQRYDSAFSLFGPPPAAASRTTDEPATPTHFSAEQERNMAARQQRGDDLHASFHRHIILEPVAGNSASFVEVEPEKDAVKPWSPKAPGAATILHMRLEDKLLLEELEEEREEAMQKERALLTDEKLQGDKDKNAINSAACCCLMM
ncbi:hypothetical protein PybrP1_003403 [[Pythium] brassicae (nom. inval.)]|nr:hypothetical protein PybrP1_003403 [[Pythium] brassicae (nom. inval.)]